MSWYKPWTWADESQSAQDKRSSLENQGGRSSWFGDTNEDSFNALGGEAASQRDYLRKLASGQDSVSAEQLRQGLQQNLAAQRSLAASAPPSNAAAAARTAAIQAGRIGSGMAGQQAIAGLQERQQAQQALTQLLMQQRQQELQAALGARQNAISSYGGVTPDKSGLEKWGPSVLAAGQTAASAFSDKRLKTDIAPGDARANEALAGLKAFMFKYKDPEKYGKGDQLGVMAQDLEDVGLGQVVQEDADGIKMLDAGKLGGANTAMLAALARRVQKLEGKEPEALDDDEDVEEMDTPMDEEGPRRPGLSVIEIGLMKPKKKAQ